MGAANFHVTGGGKWQKLLTRLSEMKLGVKAGIPKGATNANTGASIPMYAAVNEFGANITVTPRMRAWMHFQGIHLRKDTSTIVIPPRPFLRTTAKEKANSWVNALAFAVKGKADKPEAWYDGMGLVGEAMKADIKASIEKGSWAPNSSMTIAMKTAKGKTDPAHPLVDTGDMLLSVISEVVKK